MKAATIEFLRQRFGEYYRRSPLSAPAAVTQREFGFIFFDPSPETRMRRHIAFSSGTELHEYIRSLLPSHVYYSS
ncbi:MAG: DNA primase catalytic subunit PriS, partial [Methanoregulaceae archaeon]|nr:DNA primase catalytic subunit PriS [Methanoregulaceae archaeon]